MSQNFKSNNNSECNETLLNIADIKSTPKPKRKPFSVGMVVLSCLFATLFVLFCIKIKSIVFPFAFSFVFAYLFNPLVKKFLKCKIPRGLSSFIIVVLFFGIVTTLVVSLTPILFYKSEVLVSKMPQILQYLQDRVVYPIVVKASKYVSVDKTAFTLNEQITQKITQNTDYFVKNAAKFVLYSSGSLFFLFSVLLLTPILCFYMLSSFEGFACGFLSIIPSKYKKSVVNVQCKIRSGIMSYLKGQFFVITILSTYYCSAFYFTGLDGSILLGIITAIFGIIPYFGVFICTIIGVALAFYQFGSGVMPLIVFIIFVSGQIIDGSFITPNVIGSKIGINPAIIIFGFLVCGVLFGFWGVLLAVPITLVCYILINFAINDIYRQSEYYNL